jgi:hypothetical protein
MKFYISGPMANYPEHNFLAFSFVKARLAEMGYESVSSHEVDATQNHEVNVVPGTSEYAYYLALALNMMVTSSCSAICLLPGWPQSSGATLELQVAIKLAWKVYFFDLETNSLIEMDWSAQDALDHAQAHRLATAYRYETITAPSTDGPIS